ncbi:hypothetical protein BGZ47_005964 [Haplosporangium gracile]|nr:hypothetical protein BGZ47_005964 [Haplosporangium gracile]
MVTRAMRQIVLIGVICLGTIGMFNAMSSIGNAGKHSPTAQNLAITSSSIAYIIGFLVAGGTYNMLGPRPCAAFGGFTFFLYAGAMYLARDDEHSIYPPLAGVLLGLGAGCIWVTQGAMMMSYPTEDNKGKYIACFWAIFNIGAVLGSALPLIMNSSLYTDPDDVSSMTYVVYMVVMGVSTCFAFFLSKPSTIVRDNGEPVIVAKFAGVRAEFRAILSVFCDWRMLLLIPAFFFSNFSYTYQFNDFNGSNFNIRTRCLNSIVFWVAQIVGALVIGHLLDRLPWKRPKRAMLGLLVVAVLFMSTWLGAFLMQLKHNWQRKTNNRDLIDFEHGSIYSELLTIYAMFGFCDAAFAVYCYWLMGALSNKHDELSRYAGFFKAIQSLGSAVAAPLDLAQTPLYAYLITNWVLCGVSIAAMFLVCRTVTDTTIEDDDDYDSDGDSYYARSISCERDVAAAAEAPAPIRTLSSTSERDSRVSEGSGTLWDSRDSEPCTTRRSSSKTIPKGDGQYLSTNEAAVDRSKWRTSSVLSTTSMADPTTCPSPTYQQTHQHVRRNTAQRTRTPPMAEIQDDQSYLSQQQQQQQTTYSDTPFLAVPTIAFSSHNSFNSALDSMSGVSTVIQMHHLSPQVYQTSSLTAQQGLASMFGSAPSPILTTPANDFLQPVGLYHGVPSPSTSATSAPWSTASTRYDENQDMDSVETCSVSSMSSGHDSIPEMGEMGPELQSRAREDPNVCLRFSLGPTNLGILRPHLDVMKEHPVVIDQRDFRFDVYGRPADVANAIAYSFLGPAKSVVHAPHGSSAVLAGTSPEQKRQSLSVVHARKEQQLPSLEHTRNDQRECDTIAERHTAGRISIDNQAAPHGLPGHGCLINKTEPSTPTAKIPLSSEASKTTNVVSPPPDAAKWKTDYDLAWERFFGTRNNKEQEPTESLEPKPWSVTVLLSMPFRVIQYLMLTSHGFKTYLVEEPNLDACAHQGISQERLKLIAQQAGMVIAINDVQLPSIESNPEESPVWLQLDDRKALRAVLLGVGKALQQEPIRGVVQKGLGQDELELRKRWDGILDQTITSGTTPNEGEWVMDYRASRKENVRTTESANWGESPIEDRRAQWDKNSAALAAQRRRQTERARHPLAPRIASPNRIAEHRQRSERDAWSNRLTEERDRWDTAVGVDQSRWDTPSVVTRDPWTTTTSQSVGSFFTESEHHGAELSVDGIIGASTGKRSLSEGSQGSGRSSRSASSQEVPWTVTRESRPHDRNNNNNGDPWGTAATSWEDVEPLEPGATSQYYRVKRNTQTIFVNTTNPNADTVLTLKQRVIKALSSTRDRDESAAAIAHPADIHLFDYKNTSRPVDLVDSKTLANSGLVDQQIIAMVFKTPSGAWEDVYIAPMDLASDLDDLEDEPEEVEYRASKGKERA